MNALLFALAPAFGAWSIGQIAIAVIIVAAIVAIVYIALRQFGIAIPGWVINVFWVVAIAFVCIAAVKILLSMW